MDIYRQMYLKIFNSVTDAPEALNNQNYGTAAEIIRLAQVETEALFLDAQEDEEP